MLIKMNVVKFHIFRIDFEKEEEEEAVDRDKEHIKKMCHRQIYGNKMQEAVI